MSDSDSANDVFTFQNENTMVSAKGPYTNMNNITGISFRNNVFSSTMQMPRPFERKRYAKSSYNQQCLSNRRETSPMSIRSACDVRQNNFNYSFNPQGMGAPRSAFNGRSGSPMSIRSMGTSASTNVSAIDIVEAIKNKQFNKNELRVIKEAFDKYVRHKNRKKFNNRRYRKVRRHRSGYDSGEQGSDSSVSSDDRSVGTSDHKDNMSGCRSTITDISNFRRKIKESNMFKDCTDNFKYNSIHSGAGVSMNLNTTQASISSYQMPNMSSVRNMPVPANFNNMQRKPAAPVMSQKERFKSGSLTMSQRFNRSVVPTSIPENTEKEQHSGINSQNRHLATNKNPRRNIETESDEDNIFSNANKQKQTNNVNRKRSIDSEDIHLPNQKRTKTLSPCKNSIAAQKLKSCNDNTNDFVFAKPICPTRKTLKEKLISKCAVPLSDTIPQGFIIPSDIQTPQEKSVEHEITEKLEEQSNSTNVSMRPSFIKRKLFTQKLDVSEKRNLSMDNLNSPQNSMYGGIQKEKHKARKLQQATTQSCLNRDFQQDESNLLDLIQKIVPIDQMNVTNQTNKTGSQSKNMTEEDDKWDLISTNSTRKNDDDVSDTYTDEEILNSTVQELQKNASKDPTTKGKYKAKKNTPKKLSPPKSKNNQLLQEKLPTILVDSQQTRIKPFWDTDFESDAEFQPSPKIEKWNLKENLRPVKTLAGDIPMPKEAPKAQELCNVFSFKKPIAASNFSQNYTFDTTQKFNNTLRIMSHRAPKRNKLDQTTKDNVKTAVLNTECKQRTIQASTSTKLANTKTEAITIIESKKSKENATKKDNKKSPNGKKQALKTDNQNQSVQKPKNKKQDNTKAETNKNEIITIKAQQKHNSNNNNLDIEKKTLTNKLTTTKKKQAEPKVTNNNNLKTKKPTQKNYSPTIEENLNITNRPVRSCRSNSKNRTADQSSLSLNDKTNRPVRSCRSNSRNRTADQSSLSLNETMNRTLRSRKLDLTTTANKNNTKAEQKEHEKRLEIRLSNVSFSLHAEKKTVAKRAVTKITNSRLLNADESDVSFSLTPIPRQTRAASRNNTIKSTPLRKSVIHMKELPISTVKPNRKRLPNKRYVY